jgi:membrane protein YqaA with SNARE-associated domain
MLFLAIIYVFSSLQEQSWSQTLLAVQSVVFIGSILVSGATLGLALNALSTPIYRNLEGYSWPQKLADWGIRRQVKKRSAIAAAVESLSITPGASTWRLQLAQESLGRFPFDETQTLPTSLGNGLRSAETYAIDRFGLDSQLLWSELLSVAPSAVREEVADARMAMDFFVASLVLSLFSGVTVLVLGLCAGWSVLPIAVFATLAVLASAGCYRLAVQSTDSLRHAVQGLVNVARVPLADALGLMLPAKLEDEREMWKLAGQLVFDNVSAQQAASLDKYRPRSTPAKLGIGAAAKPLNRPVPREVR